MGAPHGRVHLTSIEITACPDFLQQGQKGLGFLDNPQLQAHTSQTGQLIIQKYQVVYGMCTGAIKHHIFCMVLHSPSHKAGWCTCVAQPVNLLLSQSLTCATTHGLLPRTPQTEETVFTSLSPQQLLCFGMSYTTDGKSRTCWKPSFLLPRRDVSKKLSISPAAR